MQRTCFIIAFIVFFVNGSPAGHRRHPHHHHRKSQDDLKRTLPPNIWALLAANKSARDDESGPKYNKNIVPTHDVNEIADDTTNFGPSDSEHDDSIKKLDCPKCKQNSVKMSENELANLRTEYVKNQILHKLRLNERPAPISKDVLPEPIQEGYAVSHETDPDDEFLNRHLDDYFAKTTQKIIFLTKGKCLQNKFWD